MEDGICYVEQIIFHSQTQIVSNNRIQFPESFAKLIRTLILVQKKKKKIITIAVAYLQLF